MATPDRPDARTVFRQYLDAVGLQGLASAGAAGLHTSEWYALSLITLEGALSSGELALRTGLSTGATTRLIDRLERSGYVRRAADAKDRRRVIVEPVPDSLERIEEVVGPARRHIADVINSYTPAEQAVLFDYFARAAPAFRAATEEIRQNTASRQTKAAARSKPSD
ncbi:MarR family winged helix-turn-helix transcriptional regulator [Streptomyces sp. NPDC054838]